MNNVFLAIDLKSFYASVECVDRGLDPLTTNLVVADQARTEKTICLAVTPSLKAQGIPGRPRLFEVIQKVKDVNTARKRKVPNRTFSAASHDATALAADPSLELDYIVAPPRMARYMEVSSQIYSVYLKYVSPDDIFPYSVDEVFIDVSGYLKTRNMTGRDFAMTMIRDVLATTGITATAGVGTNLYLAKIAMDITAKHIPADKDGVRIAELDELSYRQKLWEHTPLTDFWRVGKGYVRKLESLGLYTMGDIAACSTTQYGRSILHKTFGVNAELLIDHAWGYEPCTIEAVKAYNGERKSLGSGQVLTEAYTIEKARLVTQEMADALSLDLVRNNLVTDQIVLTIGYDRESLVESERGYMTHNKKPYTGKVTSDQYGRKIPEHAHGTENLKRKTASTDKIIAATLALFDRIINPDLLVRRINICANKVLDTEQAKNEVIYEQIDMFTDFDALEREEKEAEREARRQQAIIALQDKFGKNAILKGMNLMEGATAKTRNEQVGGHKA